MGRVLSERQPEKLSFSIYFGKTPVKGLELLASRLFKLFPTPFLRADCSFSGAWQLQNVSPLAVKDIPQEERDFAEMVSSEYFAGKKLIIPKRPVSRYDLAILLDPEEARPPSNSRAIKRCIKAAETLGVGVECITREDSNRLSEFDALFIRETTNVDHHTYRMNELPSEQQLFDLQTKRLQDAVENLFTCCQARIALQSERFGLPPAALRALLALGESRYLAPGELGRRLGVTKSRVTAVTTGLSRHQLIEKHPDPADARVTLLSLTPAGRRARDQVRSFMKGLFEGMLDRVEPMQRESVLASLDILRHCMEAVRTDIKG